MPSTKWLPRVILAEQPPRRPCIVVDFAGSEAAGGDGVLLRLVDPIQILLAVRASRKHRVEWVIHNIDAPGWREQRAAAFACTLAAIARSPVYVVLRPDSLRRRRICGHIERAELRR